MANNPPVPQPCHACTHSYAGISCPICKEERPAYTALKNIQRKAIADDSDVAAIARHCGAI